MGSFQQVGHEWKRRKKEEEEVDAMQERESADQIVLHKGFGWPADWSTAAGLWLPMARHVLEMCLLARPVGQFRVYYPPKQPSHHAVVACSLC